MERWQTTFDTKLDKLSEDITLVRVDLGSMKADIRDNKEDWREHMRRTDANEARISSVEAWQNKQAGMLIAGTLFVGMISGLVQIIIKIYFK